MTQTVARWTRISAGNYGWNGWFIQKFESAYGDTQWMVDSPERPSWDQFDTLAAAKRAVASATLPR